MSKLLKAALKYRSMGFSVIPCKRDKRPLVKWEEYQGRHASNGEIEAWWRKWPDAQVALVCGKISGFTVLDADSEESYQNLQENFIPESLTVPTVKTSKGYHLYFHHADELHCKTKFFEDCDLKNDGGYVLAPPSKNNKGDYTWLPGCRITEVAPPVMPDFLYNSIKDIACICNNISFVNNNSNVPKSVPATPSNSVITDSNIVKGERDDAIFNLAWYLIKGGMDTDSVRKYLYFYADNCDPPFPRKQVEIKIASAIDRKKNKVKTNTDIVREWVEQQDGNFIVTDFYLEQQIATPEEKAKVRAILHRFVERGIVEKVGKRSGEYRKIDKRVEWIDWRNAPDKTVNVWLPFQMDELVEIQPGNVIVISGHPDAGKTGVLLNVVKNNMQNFDVTYFNTEMGAAELRKRLKKFDELDPANRVPLDAWKFRAGGFHKNYADVIDGGEGKIYIIDYIPLYEDFYLIGKKIDEIFRRLNGAIAFIALQQKRDASLPKGGEGALEACRLAFSIKFQEVEILKAKNKKIDKSILHWKKNFKLVNGAYIMETSDWL